MLTGAHLRDQGKRTKSKGFRVDSESAHEGISSKVNPSRDASCAKYRRFHRDGAAGRGSPMLARPSAVGGSWKSRQRCIEGKLYRLLKHLAPSARRRLLAQQFSQPQRLALERWIMAQKVPLALRSSRRSASIAKGGLGKCLRAPAVKPKRKMEGAWLQTGGCRRSETGVYGIQCHLRGQTLYRAKVTAGPFHLVTAYSRDLAEACLRLDVLLRIRSRVRQLANSADLEVERSFREALVEELAEHRLSSIVSPQDAVGHLRFFTSVHAKRWIGRALHTPSFSTSGPGLDAGLRAWRRLRSARDCWTQIRQSYIEAWAEAGRAHHAHARLLKLEQNLFDVQRLQGILSNRNLARPSGDGIDVQCASRPCIVPSLLSRTSAEKLVGSAAQAKTSCEISVLRSECSVSTSADLAQPTKTHKSTKSAWAACKATSTHRKKHHCIEQKIQDLLGQWVSQSVAASC